MVTSNSRMEHAAWLGFGLGDVQNDVCSWDTANHNVDMGVFRLGAGNTDHRREGFDYGPGSPCDEFVALDGPAEKSFRF